MGGKLSRCCYCVKKPKSERTEFDPSTHIHIEPMAQILDDEISLSPMKSSSSSSSVELKTSINKDESTPTVFYKNGNESNPIYRTSLINENAVIPEVSCEDDLSKREPPPLVDNMSNCSSKLPSSTTESVDLNAIILTNRNSIDESLNKSKDSNEIYEKYTNRMTDSLKPLPGSRLRILSDHSLNMDEEPKTPGSLSSCCSKTPIPTLVGPSFPMRDDDTTIEFNTDDKSSLIKCDGCEEDNISCRSSSKSDSLRSSISSSNSDGLSRVNSAYLHDIDEEDEEEEPYIPYESSKNDPSQTISTTTHTPINRTVIDLGDINCDRITSTVNLRLVNDGNNRTTIINDQSPIDEIRRSSYELVVDAAIPFSSSFSTND